MNFAARGPVRIPKISGLVADAVRKRILRGELRPGDSLPPEQLLADEFGVARATVREAIRILEAEDLLRISRGARSGATILRPSSDAFARTMAIALQTRGATVRDIYKARAEIEPVAARLAAEVAPAENARLLDEQIAAESAVIAARSEPEMSRLLGEFHRVLMTCSGNITLSLLGTALEGLVTRHIALLYRGDQGQQEAWWDQMERSVRSRRKLARLIGEGDGAAAAAHWTLHMESTTRHWLSRVAGTALIDLED